MPGIASKLKPLLKPEDTAERCGLILPRNKVVEVQNAHPHPDKGFMIPVKELHGKKVVGTWHTHPGQSATLSQDDYLGFSNWPGLLHYIVGTDGVRCYVADDNGIIEERQCS